MTGTAAGHEFSEPESGPAGCVFCEEIARRVILENSLAVAIRDLYPAADGHTLVIPRRHIVTALELTAEEAAACHGLIREVCAGLERHDPGITAFNIGTNVGRDAGQSVFHCHFHIIPRRPGDSGPELGGIRHAMPGRRVYPGDYQ